MIRKRHYLLVNGSGKKIVEYSSTKKDYIFLNKFGKKDIQSMINEAMPSITKIIKQSELMTLFWEKSTKKIKNDLVLSYYYHEYLKNKKVLNVETENWFSIDYFKNLHASIIKERKLFFRKPLKVLAALRITLGKHHLNLRFENIHLAIDKVNGVYINQIHWDIKYPKSPKKIIAHSIFDDFLG